MKFIQTIVISLMISGIFTQNTVRQIDVKTSDCDDCGMTFLGQLSVKLCGSGPGACCVAENLDNIFGDDFNTGELSSFTGSNIGECNGFDLGSTNLDLNNLITIYHSGPDGGQFDYVDVFTQVHGYRCYFSKFLDNGDNELGHDCHQTA